MARSSRWILLTAALPALALPASATGQESSGCPWCAEAQALVERFGLREAATPVRESEGWAPPERIVTFFGEEFAEEFRSIAPDAEVVAVDDPGAAAAAVVGADVYIGFCRPEAFPPSSTLRWMHQLPAGVDGCVDLPGIADGRILLTNSRGIFSPQIADHAMGLLLALTRRVGRYHVQQRAGAWSHPVADVNVAVDSTFWELEGKTILVLGLGGIGTEVARRAHAFGMRVTATRNTSREGPDFVDYVGLADETLDLASQADVIVNVLPLTPATRDLVDAEFFRAMKPTAYLINVGRGEVVVTADLVDALERGLIAGAGLDVTAPEPLPEDHPLWTMPRVIITPHTAATSDRLRARLLLLAMENLRRYVAGEPLLSVVDPRLGY